MKVSFEQLKSMVVFAQIVEQGSLTAAAKQLGLTRAVASYHLKKLETQLEVTLLNRSTRTMALTEAGIAYYERCRIITEQANAANQQIENIKSEPQGLLKISCPVNVGMQLIVPAINTFKRQYPKIKIDLQLTDDVVDIIKNGFDFAIRGVALSDSNLQATKLTTMSTCICGAPDYFTHFGKPKTPLELADHQWVVYQLGSKTLTLSKDGKKHDITMQGALSTNNAAARTAFVEAGHGIGRIPLYDAWPKVQAGLLEIILDDYKSKDIELYGVFPPGAAGSKKLRLFIDYLKAYFVKQHTSLGMLKSV
ncbi:MULTISPECIES: LysR family transcriptional regulator [unclassified Pseudoalteromonas]|uniref:LysR family transcriptional regulator n=1 Tax=unclassified Pseudoalteromonas TaxID=194690 RepID=UPI000231A250|nr:MULTISPECIES: LysR family transcriptional regulator [unclassified Pseudoalteromonas]MBH0014091.1 LysR family transcriptional regulator [Pseudoalteromonas sp. NZS100_1]MBH0049876.1 LysR family transcriptional regulator [Pseudoalteromonas sp. SWYJZ19]GAA66714.1 transcriptional regulator, LysR family [Pseudoalteromonas sp. BSi20429]